MTRVFVFGSNRAGRHGAGAALYAREHHGAQLGLGEGMSGTSYAIPTKDKHILTLPLDQIKEHVRIFLEFASLHPELKFDITRVGCGLAGYTDDRIAPLFYSAPANCYFPREWEEYYPSATFHNLH